MTAHGSVKIVDSSGMIMVPFKINSKVTAYAMWGAEQLPTINIVKKMPFLFAVCEKKATFASVKRQKDWKIGRVTECAGLEIRYTLFRVSGV